MGRVFVEESNQNDVHNLKSCTANKAVHENVEAAEENVKLETTIFQ